MKSLAYIGTFILGAFAGGALVFTGITYGLTYRTHYHVDDNAVMYEDEDILVTRCSREEPNTKAAVATIIYKNNL